jgi:hypothetical protein
VKVNNVGPVRSRDFADLCVGIAAPNGCLCQVNSAQISNGLIVLLVTDNLVAISFQQPTFITIDKVFAAR